MMPSAGGDDGLVGLRPGREKATHRFFEPQYFSTNALRNLADPSLPLSFQQDGTILAVNVGNRPGSDDESDSSADSLFDLL
jgi:hypothetical protein